MTNREYDYFMMMQEKCVSFSENNTNKKIKKKKPSSNTNNQTSNELGNILLEAINEFSGANDFGPAGICQYDDWKITKVLYGDNFKMENNRFFSKYECQAPINKHTYWLPD